MDDDDAHATQTAHALVRGDATQPWPHPIYAGLRRRGRRLWHGWSDGDAGRWLDAARRDHARADSLELCLPLRHLPYQPAPGTPAPPSWTGLFGIEVRHGGRVARMAPSHMIAGNRTWQRALAECRRSLGLDADAGGEVFRVAACSMIFPLDGTRPAFRFERAGRPVSLDEITPQSTAALAHALGGWLVRNTDDSGRLVYKYWPSRGRESGADNTVRQFMGTLALGRYARWSGLPDAAAAAERNLDCQFDRFHRDTADGYAIIEHGGSAKLGAAAIAGLCLLEAQPTPRRERALAGLIAGIEALWRPDGAFRTFHIPAARNDNQNFYPGEAALFWTALFARDRDPAILARLLRTLDHYRDWHRRHRNPAFIPWHAQAHVALIEATGMRDRASFVFEMMDWLLPMQQWEAAPAGDMRGRFYDPAHREYGPPHAASTGAYLEGLAAAARLATAMGESARASHYHLAITRGLRSIRQLVFLDDADFFYISRHNRVNGGVRTEVYDNTIRVDNVQHALMAVISGLQSDVRKDADVQVRRGELPATTPEGDGTMVRGDHGSSSPVAGRMAEGC